MQSVLDRLTNKITMAPIDHVPSDNIYMENILPPSLYSQILANLPADHDYDFINHPDAVLPDGTITRKLLDLSDESIKRMKSADQDFWKELKNIFVSEQLLKILVSKFRDRINDRYGPRWPEMVIVPILYRDFAGYKINVHTDAPYKIATMQFYLPKDHTQIHLGTSFHQKIDGKFYLLKTNLFKPNSAYAFARTETSWHSVKQLANHESRRDTLALTIYEKGHEYKSVKEYV
ncbi:hypothetical protein [Aquicella lusitana]|uniref:Rps23 Pro-64 3,4-dihydroxylase Tpa1-like proline 4-hydroxylase n=1 Tax=Aquicella lusitana TaxID=254246 RepID=A0A370G853_9COXI|nr:hypothetical protein [Aquicella lusitana]RDI39947.1 hypothetical protein C8D86_1258 [Aquicella lusitana]VVC74550.1 hypothetical protein AQULUS_23160 [Aquicella lusitana]